MAADILQQIVARKQDRLNKVEQLIPFNLLYQRLESDLPIRRPWPLATERFDLIAEIKRASPSLGPINWQLTLPELVYQYELGGAGAISVLTEQDFFCGSLEDLAQVRRETSLPILRKDFLWTEYQLVESRVAGADAILLIVALLDQKTLLRLVKFATELGLETLVECHDLQEIERAIQAGAHNIGINNRNLRTFKVSLDITLELLQAVNKDCVIVSESGIRIPDDAGRLAAAGVNAILVGESCVRQANPSKHVADLLEQGRKQHQQRTSTT
ncbi:MAG: indole-3-glycerol phosphate synthase TrpC [Desulfitobacteriaceae bacterium]